VDKIEKRVLLSLLSLREVVDAPVSFEQLIHEDCFKSERKEGGRQIVSAVYRLKGRNYLNVYYDWFNIPESIGLTDRGIEATEKLRVPIWGMMLNSKLFVSVVSTTVGAIVGSIATVVLRGGFCE